jgi:PKD-like domain
MRLVFSLFLIILAQVFPSAETTAQTQTPACPSMKIRNQKGFRIREATVIYSGDKVTLTADIAGIVPEDQPTFNWTVSSGKIISGQGTATVTVSTENADVGHEVKVMVEVGGVSALGPQCDKRASETIRVYEYFCPSLSINCPTEIPEPGKPIIISVSVSGGDPDENPTYKWQVSAGKIISGQGTPQISVDTSGLAGQSITATVEVDGFRLECDKTDSCSVSYIIDPPQARKYDEYSEVSWISEETRLANFGTQLQLEPGAQGYIIVYGPRRVKQHLSRSKKFIVERYNIDAQRIEHINGGYRKRMTVQLWIVPVGATPPKPTPNF